MHRRRLILSPRMICPRCLFRAARREARAIGSRQYSRTLPRPSPTVTADKITAKPRQGNTDSHSPPSAASTSAAQPFSTPLHPSPENADVKHGRRKTPPSPIVLSSVSAGTPLKGLNFLKSGSDPVALADEEYPPWLWTLLTPKKQKEADSADLEEGLYCKDLPSQSICCGTSG